MKSILTRPHRSPGNGTLGAIALAWLLISSGHASAQTAPFTAATTAVTVIKLITLTGFPSASVNALSDEYMNPGDPTDLNNGLPFTAGDNSTFPVFQPPGPSIQGAVLISAFPTLLAPLAIPGAVYARGTGIILQPNGVNAQVVGYSIRHNPGLTYEATAWTYNGPGTLANPVLADLGLLPGGGTSSRACGATLLNQAIVGGPQTQSLAVGAATGIKQLGNGYTSQVERPVYWRLDPTGNDVTPTILTALNAGSDSFAYAATTKNTINTVVGESTGTLAGFRPSKWPVLWSLPVVPAKASGMGAPASTATLNLCDPANLTAAIPGLIMPDTMTGGIANGVSAFFAAGDPDLDDIVTGQVIVVTAAGKTRRLKNRGCVWESSFPAGKLTYSATFVPEPGGDPGSTVLNSFVKGVNSSRTAVGTVVFSKGGKIMRRGFISTFAGGMRTWSVVVPSDPKFAAIVDIRAINEEGDMLGTAQ